MGTVSPSVLFILPSASYRIPDFIDAAHELGVDVRVATEGHQTLADEMGDRLIPIDLHDSRGAADDIVQAGHQRRFDAIVPVDDQGVIVAALAGEALGLPHNPVRAATATRDKAALRRSLAGTVRQPEFRVVTTGDGVQEAAGSIGYPVVIKAVSLSASVGVIRVDDASAARDAHDTVRRILAERGAPADQPLLVERFVDGTEVSVDGLVHDGTWTTLAIFDKPLPMPGPHFDETLFVTPSRLESAIVSEIEAIAADAAEALGIVTGPVHAEVRVDGRGAVLIELAARTIGGLCGRALRFGLRATPIEQLVIRNALGERLRGTRRESTASGVAMLPVPRAGVLRAIGGVEAAGAVEHIHAVDITARLGERIRPLPFEGTYLGFVFARAGTPAAVEAALLAALDELDLEID